MIRSRKETVSWDEVGLATPDNIQETICVQEEVKQVLEAIYQLKENYRDVLCLHFLNQLTYVSNIFINLIITYYHYIVNHF